MASSNLSFIMRLIVMILSPVLYNMTTSISLGATAQVLAEPLWHTADNVSDSLCRIEERNSSLPVRGGTFILHGSSRHTCRVQVDVSDEYYSLIEIVDGRDDEDNLFLYIERQGELVHCKNSYVVISEEYKVCSAALLTERFLISLQGNASVQIEGVSNSNLRPQCAESNQVSVSRPQIGLNQAPYCQRVKGYTKQIMCVELGGEGRCTIQFQSDCNATLKRREVDFHCPGDVLPRDQKALIVYPIGTSYLDLTGNHIIKLESNCFRGLYNLHTLYLNDNNITTLDVNIFRGLTKLENVSIFYNNLKALPVGLFNGLPFFNKIVMYGNDLTVLDERTFHGVETLTYISLGWNELTTVPSKLFEGLGNLDEVYLYGNEFTTLNSRLFDKLYKLRILYITAGKLVTLPDDIFRDLTNLAYFMIGFNEVEQLSAGVFHGLVNLRVLDLTRNKISHLDYDIFQHSTKLGFIELSHNRLKECPTFKHLSALQVLNLIDNSLTDITYDSFTGLTRDMDLFVSQHEICECYVPGEVICSASANRSPYLTCDRLLSDRALVVLMWIIGINALCGNVLVLFWRMQNTKKYKVQDLLLNNLAISDSLMGVYMVMIACADIYYGEYFPMQSETWRSGVACRVTGAVAIISSEASVFFVTLISIDRYMSIKFPYSMTKLGKQSTIVTAVLLWLCSIVLGVVPSFLAGTNFKFYDNSHVCIGLPLALTKTYQTTKTDTIIRLKHTGLHYYRHTFTTQFTGLVNGLYFSSALFLGLNCLCYLIILVCYIEIFRSIMKSAKESGRTRALNEQIKLTTNVTAIVATDFACWSPVILLGILVQARVIELPPSVYAWSVTFVLPINSAINPYLYTIPEIVAKYRKKRAAINSQQTISMSTVSRIEQNPTA